jgi:hypothetical protein
MPLIIFLTGQRRFDSPGASNPVLFIAHRGTYLYIMKKIHTTILFLCFPFVAAQAQKGVIAGIITSNDGKTPLNGATVRLISKSDSTKRKLTQTDEKGFFSFTALQKGVYNLNVSYIGHINKSVSNISVSDSLVNLGKLGMIKKPKEEEVVTVVGQPPVTQKGDTVQYNASQFKTNPDATVEDLVKKLPGITIENGVVKAQGEEVRKVTIDGRDFFGDDATAALRNLPAEIVDRIQVFDRLSDQAQFTGFDDGNSQKAINVVTKAGMRNGQYGRVFAGYGTDERYSAGGNMSFFKENRRISLIGQANNINQQNFSAQDILGITGSSGFGGGGNRGGGMMMGGGGRPQGGGGGGFQGGGRGGGGGNNFFVGQQAGINKTNSFGINYSDNWGKKTTVSGSYFFNNTRNTQDQLTNQQIFVGKDSSQYYRENNISGSNNYNHRFNMRFEYKIDSMNSLMITPNISFQDNSSGSDITARTFFNESANLSQSHNSNNRETKGYNISNNLLYRHSFKKRGRTISIGLNTGINNRDGETYLENNNIYTRPSGLVRDSLKQFTDLVTKGYNLGLNISYTEPVGKDGQLQISYAPSYNKNESDQEAFRYDYSGDKYSLFDQNLSNKFSNDYRAHNAGVTFRKGNRDKMFSIGMALQQSQLNSEQVYPYAATVSRNFFNLLPEASLNRKISKRSSIRFNYRSSVNAPSVNQLQNVINNNNPLAVSTGNPDLKQQFSQNLNLRYTFTNTGKGQSLFANLFLQQNNNYIGNATFIAARDSVLNSSVTLFRGSQLSKPVNLNGYHSVRSFVTFGQPIKAIKTNMNINAGFSYVNTPGIVNGISNKSKTYTYNTGLVFSSNVSQYIDFTLSYSANFNRVVNSLQPELNNKYFNHISGAQVNLLNKKGWFYQADINNQLYRGLADGFNQDFWLLNMGIGKKFLKDQKGELKLSVFDLLKQNQSITRTATESSILDVQNQVLQQYFMLTFTYKLKNFGKAPAGFNNNRENRDNFDRRGMMGPGF